MLQEVIDLQDAAVTNLVLKTNQQDEITFKAPTGSGKTHMMADFMNRILEKNDIVFLVSSLSKGDLAKQNFNKFVEYSDNNEFPNIEPYLISSETSGENRLHIPTSYNVYVLPRDLYKDKSKLKQGALIDFLRALTTPKPLGLGKQVYVIKDECHIATSNLDSLAKDFFSKVYNFSATPNLKRGQHPDVEITELDAINAKLIKSVAYQNEFDDLAVAFEKYKHVKDQYNKLLGINPCMIIQISNKDKAEDEIKRVRAELDKDPSLKWMLIVDNDKECDTNDILKTKKIPVSKWKDYAKTNTATIDVIIFKMVITEGWDIPRACMLYQIRDSKSKQLDEQVVGRVRRNPKLLDYEKLSAEAKKLVSTAYVWGLKPKETKEIREVKVAGAMQENEIQAELKLRTTRIKKPTESNSFDLNAFLQNQKPKTVPTSIFALYKQYRKTTNEVKELYSEYVDCPQKWFSFMENIDTISTESKNLVCDYDSNMELAKNSDGSVLETPFPLISYYAENAVFKNIGNWLWKRSDGSEAFSFDSEAEKEWATILTDLIAEDAPTGAGRIVKHVTLKEMADNEVTSEKRYLVGKNYFANSDICYEYYLHGIKSSYPDFIMKDYRDRIHIFETKGLNQSSNYSINDEEYEDKIVALKKAYQYASKLTGYIFYIPIKKGSEWSIFQYNEGIESLLSKQEFIKFVKQ